MGGKWRGLAAEIKRREDRQNNLVRFGGLWYCGSIGMPSRASVCVHSNIDNNR